MSDLTDILWSRIADVPDFPKPGIVFKDITPLLASPDVFGSLIEAWAARYADRGITQIVGIESRGFIFGAALAREMKVGLTLIRKPGKLPRATRSVTYELEYGTDALHMHEDALHGEDRVVIIDDVLATGGTAAAAVELVATTGAAIVEVAFLMELGFLEGRDRIEPPIHSVLIC